MTYFEERMISLLDSTLEIIKVQQKRIDDQLELIKGHQELILELINQQNALGSQVSKLINMMEKDTTSRLKTLH